MQQFVPVLKFSLALRVHGPKEVMAFYSKHILLIPRRLWAILENILAVK